MWALTLLDLTCMYLPVLAFASPASVFIPVFCPAMWSAVHRTKFDEAYESVEANNYLDDTLVLIEIPPLAFTAQMVSCYLFSIYAYHFQKWTLFIPNSVGFLLGFLWSSLYPRKVSQWSLLKQWKIQYCLSLFIIAMGPLTVSSLPYLSSSVAAAIGVVMCSYPLPAMQQSLKENNPNLLGSQFMNIAMLICCSAWVIHSSPLVEFDAYVLLANSVGVVVQVLALLIRCIIAKNNVSLLSEEAPLL